MRLLLLLLISFASVTIYAQKDWSAYPADSGYYLSFDRTKIYYEVRGSGQPVVLVHGFIVNGNSWKQTALYTALLNAGYKVITMDLRGNGKSDKPHTDEAYADDAEAKDIIGLLTTLRIKQYKVIGYSRGSIIAARLLIQDECITAGVLGGMGADFTNPDWPRRILFYEALSGKPVKELEGMLQYVRKAGLDTVALAYMQKEQPSATPAELAHIQQSVLIIAGSEDADNGSAKTLAKMIPNAVYETVPGDHNNTSRTPEFATKVMAFLQSH